jgi:Asp-tRNA(Asn)/Glu-tRNA(Gln) amidotransferase A subunit family amidase
MVECSRASTRPWRTTAPLGPSSDATQSDAARFGGPTAVRRTGHDASRIDGLVPYGGILPIEASVDHAGPITATVEDNAILLEVIAGPDGLDPRQIGLELQDYTEALAGEAAGLRIGVLEDGFGLANSDPQVDARVRDAAARLRALGAKVESVSMPMHVAGAR